MPPSQSLLVDYFPPERRSLALAVFFLSATADNVLGLIVGCQIADAHGWRRTLVIFGLPGLLLGLIVWFVLDEPRNLPQFKVEKKDTESFAEAIAVLKKKPAFVNSVIGMLLYFTMIYGVLTFSISFVIRTQGLSLSDASASYGVIGLVAALLGNPLGGWLTDRLGRSNKAWLGGVPGYGFLFAFPLFLASYLAQSLTMQLVFLALGMFIMMMAAPPIYSCPHAVCGTARRATAIAITVFECLAFATGMFLAKKAGL